MFKIIPVTISGDGRKIPLIKKWQTEASSDPLVIEQWIKTYGSRLHYWGIPTGETNGIYALDVDVKDDNGWETIRDKGYYIPETLSQKTRSGGGHFIFKYPDKDAWDYRQKVKFDKGLDTRSDGGFIVWYQPTIPTDIKLAELPEWLKLKVRSSAKTINSGEIVKATSEFLENLLSVACYNIRNAEHGRGNEVLNEEAFKVGQYLYSGLDADYAFNRLLSEAVTRRSKAEAEATIKSGLDGGSKKPATQMFTDLPTEKPKGSIDLPSFIMSGGNRYTPRRGIISDLFNTQALKRPVLYENWSTKDITITSGDGGAGKSTMSVMESICLRLGLPYLGFNCKHPGGKTVYLTAEDSDKKIIALAGSILKQMGYEHDYDRLNFLLDGFFVKLDSKIKLVSRDGSGAIVPNKYAIDQIKEIIDDIKPDRIVLDPISYMWAFESQVNEMGDALAQGMGELRDYGNCAIEALNHIGKTSSNQKDMSQFAGRGGTALPNRSRVSRIIMSISDEDYRKYTGKELNQGHRGLICNIAKFSDGSDEFNKPFVVRREGYLFLRENVTRSFDDDFEDNQTQVQQGMRQIINIIKYSRSQDEYPSEEFIISEMALLGKSVPRVKTKHYLIQLEHHGLDGLRIRKMINPDPSKKGFVYVIINDKDEEVIQ